MNEVESRALLFGLKNVGILLLEPPSLCIASIMTLDEAVGIIRWELLRPLTSVQGDSMFISVPSKSILPLFISIHELGWLLNSLRLL